MSKISLMPLEYKNLIIRNKKKRLFSMIGVIVVSALIMSYIMLILINIIYVNQLNSLNIEKNQLESMISTYGKYSDVYNSVKKQEKLIEKANIDSYNWDTLLNTFAETIPQGMWFDSISLDYDGKKGTCVIAGRSTNKVIMAQWLNDIEKKEILKNIACKYLQDYDDGEKKVYEYEINSEIDMSIIKTVKGME
ncbi:MAG TPA: PilN domain-containing protein [Clostridiales bacterium]|nr:PilN domain-containing protein [Clostridiales bacterium]